MRTIQATQRIGSIDYRLQSILLPVIHIIRPCSIDALTKLQPLPVHQARSLISLNSPNFFISMFLFTMSIIWWRSILVDGQWIAQHQLLPASSARQQSRSNSSNWLWVLQTHIVIPNHRTFFERRHGRNLHVCQYCTLDTGRIWNVDAVWLESFEAVFINHTYYTIRLHHAPLTRTSQLHRIAVIQHQDSFVYTSCRLNIPFVLDLVRWLLVHSTIKWPVSNWIFNLPRRFYKWRATSKSYGFALNISMCTVSAGFTSAL